MKNTTAKNPSRYDDLAWLHAMRMALKEDNKNIVIGVVDLALVRLGFPMTTEMPVHLIENISQNKIDYFTKSAGNLIIRFPQGKVSMFVGVQIPYGGSGDDTIAVTFGKEVAKVLDVDSYESICSAAYTAIQQAINKAS